MKKVFVAMTLALCLAMSQICCAQGIPVMDASNIQQAIYQLIEMKKQLDELQKQYAMLENTYTSITGNRKLGDIFNNESNKNYLPKNYQTQFDRIREGGYSGLTGKATEILNKNRAANHQICATLDEEQRLPCERQIALAAQDRAFSGEAYDKAVERIQQIEDIRKKINETNDQKAILELNARLQAEQAMLQNEAIKLQIYRMVVDSERRLADQQQRDVNSKRLSTKKGTKIDALKYE
jgi:type IV secretion system protein VirB5